MTQQQTQDQQDQLHGTTDEQAVYDQSFLQQISQGQPLTQSVDWAREYFDSIEAQVRSARRVAEVSALTQIKAQIVAQTAMVVRQQVLTALRTDPTFRQAIMSSGDSSSGSKRQS